MKLLNKITIFLILCSSYLSANTFYIDEPILNSKMYMEIHGDKNNETVVFVHGLGDEASTIWKDSVNSLKENYHVIIFDLPGFGKSSKSSAEYTPEKYALVLDYIVSKYVNKPFYLIGHSMGGAISIKYTTLFENKVKKLFLINSAGILHRDAYGEFLIKVGVDKFVDAKESDFLNTKITNLVSKVTNGLNKIVQVDLHTIVRNDELRQITFQSNPTAIAAVGLITEVFFEVGKIKVPTLILWGEYDDVVPLRVGYILNKLIKNSSLEIIENSGHVPILDSKDIYLSYLDKFLNEDIEKKEKIQTKIDSKDEEIILRNNAKIDCNFKSLKITDSKNIQLHNCNLEKLVIRNSTVSLIDSNINSNNVAISVTNSSLNITSSDIKGRIAIESNGSKLDIAGTNLTSSEISILSRGINQIIFSLTTLRGPITTKVFHKKVTMQNNNKF